MLGVKFPGLESLSFRFFELDADVISVIFFRFILLVPAVAVTLHVIVFDELGKTVPSSYASTVPYVNVYGVKSPVFVPAVQVLLPL